jgi:hypothetical protein
MRSGVSVVVPALVASLTDVFHTASLNLLVTALPQDQIVRQPTPAEMSSFAAYKPDQDLEPSMPLLHGRKLHGQGLVRKFLEVVHSGIRVLSSVVDTAVNIVEIAGKLLLNVPVDATAEAQFDLLNFNYDGNSKKELCQFDFGHVFGATAKPKKNITEAAAAAAINSGYITEVQGTCKSCYAHVGVTLTAHLSILGGKLQKASVILEGDMAFKASMDLNITR